MKHHAEPIRLLVRVEDEGDHYSVILTDPTVRGADGVSGVIEPDEA